jgi:hypothetical protein
MRVELVSPKDDLIAAIASRLSGEGKDYSRAWIVFPEKRPAYYLRKMLAAREKTGFIPPRIDSIDEFVNNVYAERLGLRDRLIDVLDAIASRSTGIRPAGWDGTTSFPRTNSSLWAPSFSTILKN